jgi:hypothetical protein
VSPFFDELEAQLRSAAHGEVGAPGAPDAPRARRRRWPRLGRWPARFDLAPVLATVVVVLVVGAALVLLGRGGHQPSPPPASPPPHSGLLALVEKTPQKQLRREFSYISAATKTVLNSPACAVLQQSQGSFIHGTPDPTLLSLVGVLRRPATPADQLSRGILGGIPEVYAGSARRAFSAGGETYYVAVAALDEAASEPPARCFTLQARALAAYLPKIPAALRDQTQALQAGYIDYFRNLVAHAPRDEVCLADVGRSDNGASCGFPATEIKDGVPPNDNNGVFSGVVPDGVASITLTFPAARGRPARSLTGRVRNNVYAIPAGSEGESPAQPGVTWRSADGRVLKSVPVPTAAAERAVCRQLVACVLFQDGGVSVTSSSSGTSSSSAPGSATAASGSASGARTR